MRFNQLSYALTSGLVLLLAGILDTQSVAEGSAEMTSKVLILPPQIVLEQLSGSARASEQSSGPFESALTNAAISELKSRQYLAIEPEALDNSEAVDSLKKLRPFTRRLAHGVFNDETQRAVGHLATLSQDYLILAQFMQVKHGPGATWNPMSGAITSGMSSTLLQAALISTHTGQVIWKNEVFERKALGLDDPKLAKAIDSLFVTLNNRGGGL